MKTNKTNTFRFFVTMMAINFFTVQTVSAQAPSFKITGPSGRPAGKFSVQIVNEEDAKLSWGTTNELAVNYFIIERSINGAGFKQAAIVFSDETADGRQYIFTDKKAVLKGSEILYRISTVYKNGKVQSSNTTAVNFTTTSTSMLTNGILEIH
jgi:hypothetical protein